MRPFVLVRTVTYASLFIAVVLVFLPERLLTCSGVRSPAAIGATQVAGVLVAGTGAALALWCVFAFALFGEGTPAPFDAPRRLVVRGPGDTRICRVVRRADPACDIWSGVR
jgi:hypothetical protein